MSRSWRPKTARGSLVAFSAATGVALIAVAATINQLLLFRKALAQYVESGYTAAEVTAQLLPSQLLPNLFEIVATYGGISVILVMLGLINQRLSLGQAGVGSPASGLNEQAVEDPEAPVDLDSSAVETASDASEDNVVTVEPVSGLV